MLSVWPQRVLVNTACPAETRHADGDLAQVDPKLPDKKTLAQQVVRRTPMTKGIVSVSFPMLGCGNGEPEDAGAANFGNLQPDPCIDPIPARDCSQ